MLPSSSPSTAVPGASGYAASDRIPEKLAAMVYVDSGPATGALDPGFERAELPLPDPAALAAEENLDGLSDEQLAIFRERGFPSRAVCCARRPS